MLPPDELLANLEEALAARPDLWHAWSAVAMQHHHMGNTDKAVQIAGRAVERFPLLPRVWYDLGRVQMVAKETEKAAEAFRQALAISPGWGMASRSLADAAQLMGRYDEARGVMDAAIAASPLDASNHAYLAEVLWRRDRSPEAIERLRHVVKLDPESEWAWSRLAEWTASGDAEGEAVALARQVIADRPGDTGALLRLATLLPERQLDEALGAIAKALEMDPRHLGAHDLRALLLSRAGRFEEALAACRPAVFGPQAPVQLEARAARVNRDRGFAKQAVDLMRAVTERAPDLEWAWEMLAAWHHEMNEHVASRDAARQFVRLSPHNPSAHAYVAQAELSLGNRDAALAALHRSWESDPSFEYPAYKILEMQIEAKNDAQVEATLQKLHTHLPGARTLLGELQYRRTKSAKAPVLEIFEKLLFAPEPSGTALQAAGNVLREEGWAAEGAASIAASLNKPGLHEEAGGCYAMLLNAAQDPRCSARIRELPAETPVGHSAWAAWLSILARKNQPGRVVDFVKAERKPLRSRWELWAAAGSALVNCGEVDEAGEWLKDWREWKGASAWALQVVALAMRCLEKNAEAQAASARAVTLPRDGTCNFHHAWLALDGALAKRLDDWKAHRESLSHDQITNYEKTLLVLARCVVDVASAEPPERKKVFERCLRKLRSPDYVEHYGYRDVSAHAFNAVRTMASDAGVQYSRSKWLSSLNQSSDPRMPWGMYVIYILLVIIVIVILIQEFFGAK